MAQRQKLLLTLRWGEAIPGNPNLALLSPYQSMMETIHTLTEHDALRPRLVSSELKRVVSEMPSAWDAGSGVLNSVTRRADTGAMIFNGSARIPHSDRPADCVVIGYSIGGGRWELFTVAKTATKPAHAAFELDVQATGGPMQEATFRAWSVDLAAGRAYPMAGAVRIPSAP